MDNKMLCEEAQSLIFATDRQLGYRGTLIAPHLKAVALVD